MAASYKCDGRFCSGLDIDPAALTWRGCAMGDLVDHLDHCHIKVVLLFQQRHLQGLAV